MTRILLLLALLLAPVALFAQDPAVLVADQVELTQDRVLVARGNVQVFQGERGLTARRITYDQAAGRLVIDGPITLQDGEDVLILASAAELDADMRNGILRSARMVIHNQLQLASDQIMRVNGRYSQLSKTAVTSCKVCDDGRPPLWQIRARRVVHDQEEKQLYFDGAQLRFGHVPVLYLPRLRLPDPTLDRATGFLTPKIRTTSQLATGIKLPYFIKIGDHKDLTVTPYLSSKTRTLELRYRQAFQRGRIEFNGATTRDDLQPGEPRGYLFGEGRFDLARDFKLAFDVELTSDKAYLKQYDYSSKDRLDSAITLWRVKRDEYVQLGLRHYNSLRADEDNDTLPTVLFDQIYERRMFLAGLPGELRFQASGHTYRRPSSTDQIGRDAARAHAELHWLNRWVLRGGLLVDTKFGFAADLFRVAQDSNFPSSDAQISPQGSIALRLPMRKVSARGARQFLEPIVQLGWTGGTQAHFPNEESTRTEFDEGNLLALSRFAETDRREHGTTLALGVNWAHYDPSGWEAYLSLGQILRDDAVGDFTETSGLTGDHSDILVAGQLKTQDGLALGGRALLKSGLEFTKAELRGDWIYDRGRLGGSYLWLIEDAGENRPQAVSELTLDGSYDLDPQWTLSANWRYDAEDRRTARAGLGLTYSNECMSVDMAVERRYGSTTDVEPDTKFGLTIGLQGFSARTETERYTRSCK